MNAKFYQVFGTKLIKLTQIFSYILMLNILCAVSYLQYPFTVIHEPSIHHFRVLQFLHLFNQSIVAQDSPRQPQSISCRRTHVFDQSMLHLLEYDVQTFPLTGIGMEFVIVYNNLILK